MRAKKLKKYLRNSIHTKDSLHHHQASAYDDIITDIFHDGRCLPSDQGQQNGCLVEVPEQEQLPSACRRAPYVAKQVSTWVPEDTVKTQDHLMSFEKTNEMGEKRNVDWLFMQKLFWWDEERVSEYIPLTIGVVFWLFKGLDNEI